MGSDGFYSHCYTSLGGSCGGDAACGPANRGRFCVLGECCGSGPQFYPASASECCPDAPYDAAKKKCCIDTIGASCSEPRQCCSGRCEASQCCRDDGWLGTSAEMAGCCGGKNRFYGNIGYLAYQCCSVTLGGACSFDAQCCGGLYPRCNPSTHVCE